MSERESYRRQEHGERLSVFAGSFRTDPYDYSNIVTHLRPLLGYRQRYDTFMLGMNDQDTYHAVYTDSEESVHKMHQLGELFAARPVSHTLYYITTGRWGELLQTVTDKEAARAVYELSDEYPPHVVDLMASRGLRTTIDRTRQMELPRFGGSSVKLMNESGIILGTVQPSAFSVEVAYVCPYPRASPRPTPSRFPLRRR